MKYFLVLLTLSSVLFTSCWDEEATAIKACTYENGGKAMQKYSRTDGCICTEKPKAP